MKTCEIISNTTNASSNFLLEAKNISQNFDYPLFNDISLSLEAKESIAIIGISGSGKSTFLNILSSLLKPQHGEVLVENKNILDLNDDEILHLRRNYFGIIFQAHYLFRGFTADENLKISQLLSNKELNPSITNSLKIEHVMHQGIGELSGGQQQRLSIARILQKEPKIIFADEPTGNLDKQTALEVMAVLFDYIFKNNAGMMLVTHEEDIAFKCDKVYRLNEQKLERIK